MSNIDKVFLEFSNRWALGNPKPIVVRDFVTLWGIRAVIIGSMLLSGTRTGSMIGATQQFASFVSLLALPDFMTSIANGLEAIFGFLTIEMAIFMAGYLLGGNSKEDRRWYFAFIFCAIVPAIVSNIAPGFKLLGASVFQFWLVVVNIIIGLSTIALAVIGGRVLGMIEYLYVLKKEEKEKLWVEKRQVAWLRSFEYRAFRSKSKAAEPKLSVNPKLHNKILLNLKGGDSTIQKLSKDLKISKKDLMMAIKDLNQKELIVVNGLGLSLNGIDRK